MRYEGQQTEALERMARFLTLIYVPAWLNAPSAADAPHDASLSDHLQQYKSVDSVVTTDICRP